MSTHDSTDARATVREIAADIDITMLTTHAPDGSLRSRPMSLQEATEDGDLWYVASGDSDIVSEIAADPRVNAALAGKGSWLSVTGTGIVSRDRAVLERIWTPSAEAWFPEGIDTPGVVAINVIGESAEFWDGPGAVVTLVKTVAARVQHKEPEVGRNETVEL
ncbi:pyridoxamine 5'-phosphate oxidase [Serinibacter arcticus]|uniref:Pyridoxamine 5'-phosphate oxidase n=1 Tax=Serinibacter arcticus TaxID=1655435 RepID=A0A2U1ZXA9_9MICO|nr:pyridoxamine 5'-phosphate oxidase family protein [Serinibacter arcticus]PWD51625.1 pyridoxamine 5'-phosphate oxidase [Serinibacter arcticus]